MENKEDVKIVITMTDEGRVDVNGPLSNKVLFLGLLEIAKHVMFDWHDKNAIDEVVDGKTV